MIRRDAQTWTGPQTSHDALSTRPSTALPAATEVTP